MSNKLLPMISLAIHDLAASSRQHSFATGRFTIPSDVFTSTTRTTLSLPGNVSQTLPSPYLPLEMFLSVIWTMSPILRLSQPPVHFDL